MIKRKIKHFLFILITVLTVISPLLCVKTVYATDQTIKFTGSEDAEEPDDFENYYSQCMYQIYSFCRSYGLSYEQAMGVLGCMSCESIYPEQVECWTNGANPAYRMSERGGSWDNEADREAYISDICEPFYENHHEMSKGAALGNNTPYYMGTDSKYWMGIGITGFTGPACENLVIWSVNNDAPWWIMSNQLIWSLLPPSTTVGESGYTRGTKNGWELYKELTDGETSIEVCARTFASDFVGVPEGNIPARISNATSIAKEIPSSTNWDSEYGDGIVSGAGLSPAARMKTGVIDYSIIHDVASKVLVYPLNHGFILDSTEKTKEDMLQKNIDVYENYVTIAQGGAVNNNTDNSQYALYELFGDDLHWYRYLGESTYAPQLLDHVYSRITQGKLEKGIDGGLQIVGDLLHYKNNNFISCRVYKDRPEVLTSEDIQDGYKDPRVSAMHKGYFNGYVYELSNLKLTISKYISSVVGMLLGPRLLNTLNDIVTDFETSKVFSKGIKPIALIIVGFAMLAFIFSLVKHAIHYAQGKGAGKQFIERFLIGILALGLLFASLANPTRFNNAIFKLVTGIDSIFADGLKEIIKEDDKQLIAISEDSVDDLQVSAMIWKTCIFNAWCRGQFGREYDKLYTQYADVANSKKMPQSHQDVDITDNTGQKYYNSAKYTGDVYVPIGDGVFVRNWAAYLYSCGSNYHLDYNLWEEASELTPGKAPSYPIANTTAYDATIMADTFRVIDAQMNIAPEEYNKEVSATGAEESQTALGEMTQNVINKQLEQAGVAKKKKLIINNYTDAQELKPNFYKESVVMLLNASLLLFFIPVIASKFKNFILLIISALQIIYHSIVELFKEQSGFSQYIKTFKEALIKYFIAVLKGYIMLILYYNFVDKGFVKMVIYCILCIVILSFSFSDIRRFTKDTKRKIKQVKAHL